MRITDLNSGNFGLLKPNEGSNIELYQPFVVDFLVGKPLTRENAVFIRTLQDNVIKEMDEEEEEEEEEGSEEEEKGKKEIKKKKLDLKNQLQEYYNISQDVNFKYVNFEIYNGFINANGEIKYNDVLYQIFKPQKLESSFRKFMRNSRFFRKKKKAFGMIAINLIEQDDFEHKLDFISREFKKIINSEFKDSHINESLDDFSQYIESIKWNFNHLKSELIKDSIKDK